MDYKIAENNAALQDKSAQDIVRWGIRKADGHAVVSTNFRPYEAVILHICVQIQPDIPVIWVDHGYNRPATYQYAEQLSHMLNLNLKIYVPKLTVARREAVYGPVPDVNDEVELKKFSEVMKLEPFQRGMREIAPTVWFTALRKVQNPNRATLDILSRDETYSTIKISPVFYWTDADMEAYLRQYKLPNEWDYFDPAKADESRECGLHVR